MDRMNLQSKALEFLKKYRYVALIVAVGVILMCLPGGERGESESTEAVIAATEPDLEEKLVKILSQIEGAGKVQVLLTEEAGQSVLYQTDQDTDSGSDSLTQRSDTVILSGADREEQGLVRQINPPVYLGAVVVCQGADKATVRLAIVEAVSAATGLGADKISVLKMK